MIHSGEDGLLVPVGNSEGLAAAMIDLLDDPERRHRFGCQARRAAQRFSVDNVLPAYIAAIRGVAPGHVEGRR